MAEIPGAPANSEVMISEKARPIQSAEESEPRFSNRRMAMRWNSGVAWREQLEKATAKSSRPRQGPGAGGQGSEFACGCPSRVGCIRSASREDANLTSAPARACRPPAPGPWPLAPALKDTRLRRQQFLELREIAHGLEFGVLLQLLLVVEALFQGLLQILDRQIVPAGLGVQLGEIVVVLGAVPHAAIFEHDPKKPSVLKDVRIDLKSRLVFRHSFFFLLAREVPHAKVNVKGS